MYSRYCLAHYGTKRELSAVVDSPGGKISAKIRRFFEKFSQKLLYVSPPPVRKWRSGRKIGVLTMHATLNELSNAPTLGCVRLFKREHQGPKNRQNFEKFCRLFGQNCRLCQSSREVDRKANTLSSCSPIGVLHVGENRFKLSALGEKLWRSQFRYQKDKNFKNEIVVSRLRATSLLVVQDL